MQGLQLQGLNKVGLVELPVPVPGPGEVLIRAGAATICTSDLHDMQYNPFGIRYPKIMGHEGAGTVVQAGAHVTGFPEGTRVAAHPVVPCGKCGECLRGFAHICSAMGHLGIDRDGCFAEYFVQRADRVAVLPDHIPFHLGALMEPVAVCLQAIARAGDIHGHTVLIAGDGPFGNIIARLATRAGAGRVMVTGREPFRLNSIPHVERLHDAPPNAADVAILAVNAPAAADACIKALRLRGRMVVFSSGTDPYPLDMFTLHIKELEIAGACNDENRMEEALECLDDPSLALHELVTHRLPFLEWEKAIALARDGHDRALKVALMFEE